MWLSPMIFFWLMVFLVLQKIGFEKMFCLIQWLARMFDAGAKFDSVGRKYNMYKNW